MVKQRDLKNNTWYLVEDAEDDDQTVMFHTTMNNWISTLKDKDIDELADSVVVICEMVRKG